MRKVSQRAFTLVELVAVIVVLAIMAGVAIPKFMNYSDQAKTSALEGALGGVRAGVANFYAEQALAGDARYPSNDELVTPGDVMQEALPKNPYNNMATVKSVTDRSSATARSTDGTTGWCYFYDNDADPPTAVFWANSTDETTATGGDDGATALDANEL